MAEEKKTKRVSAFSFQIKGRIVIDKANNSAEAIAATKAIEDAEKVLTAAGAVFATTAHFGQIVVDEEVLEPVQQQAAQ